MFEQSMPLGISGQLPLLFTILLIGPGPVMFDGVKHLLMST